MANKWTKEQAKALEYSDKLTVISAGAGSGKTTVLVEYVIRRLLDESRPVSADKFLIVTFSNDSAREFRHRIEEAIKDLINKDPQNKLLKKQRLALQKADISTIHSFCMKLVRENFELLDVRPDFMVADDALSLNMHSLAIEQAMIYGYQNPVFSQFVSFYGKSSQDKSIREFLKEMHFFFSALPNPTLKARELAESYAENSLNLENSIWFKEILEFLKLQADYLVNLSLRMNDIYDIGDFEGYENSLFNISSLSNNIAKAIDTADIDSLKSLLAISLPRIGSAKPPCENSDVIKTIYGVYKETLKSIKENVSYFNEETFNNQMGSTKQYIYALVDVFIYYQDILIKLKKQKNSYEFSDFEHFALSLLQDENQNRTPLAKELSNHYEYILEDEFQDTSYVQDAIFSKIAKDNESNLYVVGDVKQSIYEFRKATPEIFLKKRQIGLDDETLANTIFLSHNFRSDIEVIKGVNSIFNRIMTPSVGGVDYEGIEFLQSLKAENENIAVDVNLYSENEALEVAKTINDMITKGYEISDKGKMRKVCPSDFCILLKSIKRAPAFKDALKKYGYDVYTKDDELILNTNEVQSLISFLRVISNPLKEIPLFASMFGDLINFSLDDILKLKPKGEKENLYKLLLQSKNENAKELINLIKEFSFVSSSFSLDKLIKEIIKKTSYNEKIALCNSSLEKRENIRWFINFAKEYSINVKGDLSSFLRYIDSYLTSNQAIKKPSENRGDSINIMTIHTSKGLEFPICFVSSLATGFNNKDSIKRMFFDTKLSIGMFSNSSFGYNNSTIAIRAIKNKLLQSRANEEMRVLYVALTRAKNRLFLTGKISKGFTLNSIKRNVYTQRDLYPHPYALIKASCFMDWIFRACLDNSLFLNEYPFLSSLYKENNKLNINIITPNEEDILEKTDEETGEVLHLNLDKIKSNLNFVYKDLLKTSLPIKVSVSDISKKFISHSLATPDFIKSDKDKGAKIGTAMHLFAQFCDIKLAREDLEKEYLSVCKKFNIDPSLLNKSALNNFINSPLADLILKSDFKYNEKDFIVPYPANKIYSNEYENEEIFLQGIIDCVLILKDEVIIIDYKTDNVPSLLKLKERYQSQLDLYKHAAKILYSTQNIKSYIYSFKFNDYIEV